MFGVGLDIFKYDGVVATDERQRYFKMMHFRIPVVEVVVAVVLILLLIILVIKITILILILFK